MTPEIDLMAAKGQKGFVQGSLFEEDYLLRTLGSLGYSPEIALTELVANAWDAGATRVEISIPDQRDQKLIIKDNGVGLTKKQFYERWMRLGYNRIKHQGSNVIFPPGVQGKRMAYGRYGIGRHGLLCFNNEYTVRTSCKGQESTFVVTTLSEKQPFVIQKQASKKAKSHGTSLEVLVTKHLPKPEEILQIISARFLHDPKFVVSINNKTVPLEQHIGFIDSKEIKVDNIKLVAHFIDSQKASRSTLYQGIAFWQGGRLVGDPSWILGREMIVDGRTTFAKRYTVVVKTNDLADYILDDWTGFKRLGLIDSVNAAIADYVSEMQLEVSKETVEDTKQQVKNDFARDLDSLTPLGRYEVNEALQSITTLHPMVKHESLSIAMEAIINLEKTRSGKELLVKLSKLPENDVNGLNDLLEKWTVRDALTVLDEIDNRVSVIEAIRKLSDDKDVDELHVLHPLLTGARWLFGPEFESAEYASNNQLHTAVEKVFNVKIQKGAFKNHKKRPDIVVLSDSTLSISGTDNFDGDSGLTVTNKLLIIELKKGDFKLTRKERQQAADYVEDFMNCGSLIGTPTIEAFVVGKSFSESLQQVSTVGERGKIRVCTFAQLVDTAEKRLFGLRKKLGERYDDIPGMDLFKRQAIQLRINEL